MSSAAAEAAKDRGNEATKTRNFGEAVRCYTEAIQLDSTNATYYSNRSAAYTGLRDYENAIADADKALAIDPKFVRAYQRKGQALSAQQKYVEAIKVYQAALEIDPNNAQIMKLFQDTLQFAQESQMREAQMEQLQGLQEIFRDPVSFCYNYPELEELATKRNFIIKANEIRDDFSKFQEYSDDEDIRAFAVFALKRRAMEKLSPEERASQQKKDQEMREEMMRFEDAERDRKRKEEKERKERELKEKAEREANSRTPEQTKALQIKEEANQLYKKKQFTEALALYDQAATLDPTNITYLNNKAACYMEMGEIAKAREISETAVDIGRENRADFTLIARALTRIGSTYLKEENYEKAIECYKRSLLEHRSADTLNLQKKAEKLLEEKKAREYYSPELSAKHKEEGNEFFKKQNYPEAIKCYTEAVKRQPDNHVNYSNRAACYIKLMAYPEALKDADKCIAINPKFAKGYLRKGQAHFLMKDNNKALEAYDAGLKLEPNNAEIQAGIQKVMNSINSGEPQDEEAVRRNVERDPELQAILRDPMMQQVLQDLKSDPKAAQHHMRDPITRANIEKLIAAGIISTR
eukprot:TRINITY_DN14671_c0_g1_i1.p1 TRINITY_DN14671_c0_g1~~TRINITY_DN14671_c0_g1_i1.p1  ORF type:complete len:582 (-),score=207.47 TRINITY_DN14671_c0_g1_i1:28-1773(-)